MAYDFLIETKVQSLEDVDWKKEWKRINKELPEAVEAVKKKGFLVHDSNVKTAKEKAGNHVNIAIRDMKGPDEVFIQFSYYHDPAQKWFRTYVTSHHQVEPDIGDKPAEIFKIDLVKLAQYFVEDIKRKGAVPIRNISFSNENNS